jgi:hypothetical protein
MSFSIRLHTIKCLEESDEASNSDEPYVLVTSANLLPSPLPPNNTPRATTFLYGEWGNFDDDEVLTLIGERPFWGVNSEPWEPEDIANVDDLCFQTSYQ